MKIKSVLILMLTSFLLLWCWNTDPVENISFDKYSIPLNFESQLEQTEDTTPTRQEEDILLKIVEPYYLDERFHDSIIAIQTSQIDLEEFFDTNINKLEDQKYTIEDTDSGSFDCNTNKIKYKKSNVEVGLLDMIIYNTQFTFEDEVIYVISYATNDVEKHKQFNKDIKDIYCI